MGEKTDRPVETGAELEAAGVAAVVLATLNALGVGTNAGAGQGTSGALGSVLGASDQQNKTDVNVPEVLTGLNAHTQQNAQAHIKNVDNLALQIMQNGITQSNMVTVNEINNSDLIAKQAIRHTDLAIDREWNPDEVAALFATYFGRLAATMNNPIPPEE
jgi:hypothetical protein